MQSAMMRVMGRVFVRRTSRGRSWPFRTRLVKGGDFLALSRPEDVTCGSAILIRKRPKSAIWAVEAKGP